ncbi:MAG TPA: hypothetical protein P5208_07435 [Smithellaceae bacterium]|nr:hypothetical protein [Smithellaceae bacterium]HRV45121.1 hypothetical protein [Smithellaceae bacterium]
MSTQLAVPLFQVALLLGISTLILFFGRVKLALLINYCFTFYWGFFLNPSFRSDLGELMLNTYTYAYIGVGLIIIVLALIGFMSSKDR